MENQLHHGKGHPLHTFRPMSIVAKLSPISATAKLFWAAVCKTVRPMLSVCCLSVCLSCLSVTLVYCGQTVGWIKMNLGMEIGLGPGYVVLDRNPAPLLKGAQPPNFWPISIVAKRSSISATVVHLFNIGDLCIAKVSAVSGPLLSGRGLLGVRTMVGYRIGEGLSKQRRQSAP